MGIHALMVDVQILLIGMMTYPMEMDRVLPKQEEPLVITIALMVMVGVADTMDGANLLIKVVFCDETLL